MRDEATSKGTLSLRIRKRISIRKRLLFALCGCVLGCLLAEGLLILADVSYPLPYEPDEYCGTRLRPGFRGYWTKEGFGEFEINSAGFRDREHSLENPQGVIRVAVLGDSYIEALQVPVEAMFASVLERELAERGAGTNQRFEVLSFGVSGFGTAQELLWQQVRSQNGSVPLVG